MEDTLLNEEVKTGEELENPKRKNKKIDQSIKEIVEWKKTFKDVPFSIHIPENLLRKYATTEEEYEEVIKEYIKMTKIYTYLKYRKNENKLNPAQIQECKEGNVGGVFGYPTYIENLAQEYAIDEKDISYIVNKYNSMEEFLKLYRERKIDSEDIKYCQKLIRDVIDVDCNPNSEIYNELYRNILGKEVQSFQLYSSHYIDKLISKLSPKYKEVIEARYGLSSIKIRTLGEIGEKIGITGERVRQIEKNALIILRKALDKITIHIPLENELLTDEEKQEIKYWYEKIKNSYIRLKAISIDINSEEYEEFLQGVNVIKEINKRIKQREKRKLKKEKGIEERIEEKDIPIEELNLSIETYNRLKDAGYLTVNKLKTISQEDLIREKHIDGVVLQELIEKLALIGVYLKPRRVVRRGIDEAPIEVLDLTFRPYNCLKGANICTLGQIKILSQEDLLKINRLGEGSLKEILDKLEKFDIHLPKKSKKRKYNKKKSNNNSRKRKVVQVDRSQELIELKLTELELIRNKKNRLKDEVKGLETKLEGAKELVKKYEQLENGNMSNTNGPDFKDE